MPAKPEVGTPTWGAPLNDFLDTLQPAADLDADVGSLIALPSSATAVALGEELDTKVSKSANLSDLVSATSARGNLGLGTAATQSSGSFDAAGAATTAQAAAMAASDPIGAAAAAQAASIPLAQKAAASGVASLDSSSQLVQLVPAANVIGLAGLDMIASATDYGAIGDGVADDTAALADMKTDVIATGKIGRIPKGSYLQSGTVYSVSGDWLWLNHGYTTAVNAASSARANNILITTQTANTSPHDPNESRVAVSVTVAAKGSHHGTGVRSNLQNSSDDGNGCTAFYGSAVSDVDASWSAALHGETRHGGGTTIGVNSESASYEATGTLYGVVVNNSTSGADPTHPITGASAVAATTAIGVAFKASSISTGWVTGIDVSSTSVRTAGNVIKSAATPQRHFWATGAAAVADIHLEGASDYGIILGADYVSGNAIRLKTGNAIAFESAGSIAMSHSPTPNRILMKSSGTERLSFEVSSTPKINISGTQVIGPRQTGWTASTGTANKGAFATGSATTLNNAERIKALEDAMFAHGLIGV